ncbi:MAG: hypothetical protein AAGB28_14635 [Pseudomonadota bacterium]
MTPLRSIALLSTLITGVASAALGQPAGVTPPEDVFVEASLSADGIALSTDAVTLTRGGYYRLHLTCVSSDQGEPDFSFATDPLVRNSHLRVQPVTLHRTAPGCGKPGLGRRLAGTDSGHHVPDMVCSLIDRVPRGLRSFNVR